MKVLFFIVSIFFGLTFGYDVQGDTETLLRRIENLEQNQEDLIKLQANTIKRLEKELTRLLRREESRNDQERENEAVQKRLTVTNTNPVAFSAYINHFIQNVAPNTVIPFEMVTTNEGKAFDGGKGIFTCPTAGLYLFLWNIMVDSKHGTQVELRVNGVTRRWSYAYSTVNYANGANHDIVRLEEGDKVWIADGEASGEIHPHHTTFSGVLLFH